MPPAIRLVPAIPADAPYLATLEARCMRGYAEALWGEWRPSGSADAFPTANYRLIERDGDRVGAVAVVRAADHLFVDALYVDAPFRRQGIGAAVLRRVIADAAGTTVRLSVLATNPADAFYRREGFVVDAETPERRFMRHDGSNG